MSFHFIYTLTGIALFFLGFYSLIIYPHLLRKILALNIMGSGVFLVLISIAKHAEALFADPVPHAMVITGIVIAISATALALVLMLKLAEMTGKAQLSEDEEV
jgi:multicomponent Na+:H+ antiporter subunit C